MNRLALAILLALFSFARVECQQAFKGGLIAGTSASQIDGDHQSGYNQFGLTAGVYTGRDISSTLSWYLEFKYTGKGAAEHISLLDSLKPSDQLYNIRLHYLEFPLYLSYKVSSAIYLEGGVSIGYLLSSRIFDYTTSGYADPERTYNNMDYTGLLGARFEWSENWAVDLRLNYSLVPFYKPTNSISSKQAFYNNTLQIGFFYRLQN